MSLSGVDLTPLINHHRIEAQQHRENADEATRDGEPEAAHSAHERFRFHGTAAILLDQVSNGGAATMGQALARERALERLAELRREQEGRLGRRQEWRTMADEAIAELLTALGHADVVAAWTEITWRHPGGLRGRHGT